MLPTPSGAGLGHDALEETIISWGIGVRSVWLWPAHPMCLRPKPGARRSARTIRLRRASRILRAIGAVCGPVRAQRRHLHLQLYQRFPGERPRRDRTGAISLGAFQPALDLDLEKLAGWDGGHFHTHGLITHGPFFSPTYLGNFLTVTNLEAGPVARLYSFWYEQNAFNDRLSVRAGLMSADSQFLQSKTAANFINNGISWPMFLAANLPGGGPAYPLPAPGIRVRIKPRDECVSSRRVQRGPERGQRLQPILPLPTGTVFSFRGGAFVIAEASYLPNQGKEVRRLPGAYRIGAWYHTSPRFGDQRFDNTGLSLANPMSTGIPLEHTGDAGIYGVVDQMLYRVPGTDDRGLSGFARAGGVPNDRNLINFYADAGLLYKGLINRRPDDKVGVAAGYARVGDNARGLDADIGSFGNFFYPVRSREVMVEMIYQAQIAPWWMLQPEVQ